MAGRFAVIRLGRRVSQFCWPTCQAATRSFAAVAEPAGEEDIVVSVFREEQKKFRKFFDEAKDLQIPLSGDEKAVADFHNKVKNIKDRLKMPSDSERLRDLMEFTMVSSDYDVRAFLTELSNNVPEEVISDCTALVDEIEAETGENLTFGNNPDFKKFIKRMEEIAKKHGVLGAKVEQLELEAEKERLDRLRTEAQQEIEKTKDIHGLKFVNVDAAKLKPTVG